MLYQVLKQSDFDERVDIMPVSDPNIFSMSQRVTLAQTQLQWHSLILSHITYMKRIKECINHLV